MSLSTDHNRPVIVLESYLPKRENGRITNSGYRKLCGGRAKFKSWSTEYDGEEAYASAVVERPNGGVGVVTAESIVFADNEEVSVDFDPHRYTHEELVKLELIKE